PLLTQVPPTSLRSMIAVLRPALPSRTASDGPAWPVPMTIASNSRVMRLSLFADEQTVYSRDPGANRARNPANADMAHGSALTLEVIEAMTPEAFWNASLSMPLMWWRRAM